MSEVEKVQFPWAEIDTLLLDMDGTLLDLAFDNFFWLELVPREYARTKGMSEAEARERVHARYAAVAGTLPWYCLDHWSGELGLDVSSLKRAHRHRIRYLPRAEAFLEQARRREKRLILVTNAHRVTLAIKCEETRVDAFMDAVVSSHDYGIEKERIEFWGRLKDDQGIDPERSALLEDSLAVLTAARRFGIRHAVAIRRPDSTHATRAIDEFVAVDGVASLLDRPASNPDP
jgi:putative hydrolase of the HAD superfamily